jgi:hypothetical protein
VHEIQKPENVTVSSGIRICLEGGVATCTEKKGPEHATANKEKP